MNKVKLFAGEVIDLDILDPLYRSVAVTIAFVSNGGDPWWEYIPAAREVIKIVKQDLADKKF